MPEISRQPSSRDPVASGRPWVFYPGVCSMDLAPAVPGQMFEERFNFRHGQFIVGQNAGETKLESPLPKSSVLV